MRITDRLTAVTAALASDPGFRGHAGLPLQRLPGRPWAPEAVRIVGTGRLLPEHLRHPLPSPLDPLGILLAEIGRHAPCVPMARLAPGARARIAAELAAARQALEASPGRPPLALIAFNAAPVMEFSGQGRLDVDAQSPFLVSGGRQFLATGLDAAMLLASQSIQQFPEVANLLPVIGILKGFGAVLPPEEEGKAPAYAYHVQIKPEGEITVNGAPLPIFAGAPAPAPATSAPGTPAPWAPAPGASTGGSTGGRR